MNDNQVTIKALDRMRKDLKQKFLILLGYYLVWIGTGLCMWLPGGSSGGVFLGFFLVHYISLFWVLRLTKLIPLEFNFIYNTFCSVRLIPENRRYRAKNPKVRWITPRFKVFWFANDLLKLEKDFLGYIRREFVYQERQNQLAKWSKVNEKLWGELETTLSNFRLNTVPGFVEDVKETWSNLSPNPQRRKQFVQRFGTLISHKEWMMRTGKVGPKPGKPQNTEQPVLEETDTTSLRIDLLREQASNCESERARELYEQGMQEPDKRKKLRLFKEALHEDRKYFDEVGDTDSPIRAAAPESQPKAVKYLNLNEFMQTEFKVKELIPKGQDAEMVKQVLIELLDPGKTSRRFKGAYRVESRLKQMVQNLYSGWVEEEFNSSNFHSATLWMVREGILLTKPKSEPTYSLNSQVSSGKSPEAQQIISYVMEFNHKLRELQGR